MNSIRLGYDELVYLCVSLTRAKEIYGLKPKSADIPVDWKEVRSGLIEKGFLTEDGEGLLINPRLAYMIHTIGNPRMFISVHTAAERQTHGFYLARHFAVTLAEDPNAAEQYLLTAYETPEDVRQVLDDHINRAAVTFMPGLAESRISFTPDEYESYLTTLRKEDRDTHQTILTQHGLSTQQAAEIYDTLHSRAYKLTMVLLSFDPQTEGGKQVAEQLVFYAGSANPWCMEITPVGTGLLQAGPEWMNRKLEVISSLFKYF